VHGIQLTPLADVVQSEGLSWYAPMPIEAVPDLPDVARNSKIVLLEDGKPLAFPHTNHNEIRRLGGGRYSHWDNYLLFSTSDNSSPLSNGRRYSVTLCDDSDCPEIEAEGLDLEAAYQLFRESDLLIVRNLIPVTRLAHFRDLALAAYERQDELRRQGMLSDEHSYKTGFLFDAEVLAATGGAFSMYDIPSVPALHALVSYIFRREGAAAWRYFGAQLRRVSAPKQSWSIHTKWHNDQHAVVDDGLLLVVNSPLMPIGFDAPGLAFVKTPRDRVKQYVGWDPSKPYEVDEGGQSTRFDGTAFQPERLEQAFGDRMIRPRLKPGDVAIFTGWTIHSAYVYPEMTGWRIGVENRFKEMA